jgi:hypothetical protein
MLGVVSNGSCNSCHSSAGGVARVTAQLVDGGPTVKAAMATNTNDSPASGDSSASAPASGATPALAQIATGAAHGCVVKADGTVLCWGATQASIVPLPGVQVLSAAGNSTCARVVAGDMVSFHCWGATPQRVDLSAANLPDAMLPLLNADSSAVTAMTAPDVAGLESTSFTHIAAAAAHSCGITTDNHVKCWEGTHASVDIPVL